MILFTTHLLLCIFANFHSVNTKVSSVIQNELDQGNNPNVIVECHKPQSSRFTRKMDNILKELSNASQNPETSRAEIITNLVQRQQDTVVDFLAAAITVLNELKIKFEVLWVSFEIFVFEATAELISRLVQIGIVLRVRHDPIIPHIPPKLPESQPSSEGNETWNIDLIDARCNDIKCLGEGVILGFIDTGARTSHVEIESNWLGMETPIGFLDGNLKSCIPRDDNGHGTHVVGTACGKTVGVAPLAKWMMCLSCAENGCSESSLKICALWLSCPYECGDTSETKLTKNCTLRPHVINNSWGGLDYYSPIEVRYGFYEYVEYWNSLGIISIFSAGNDGPGCNSVSSTASYDIAFSVGAVNKNVSLASFSSIGPGWSSRPLTKDSISVGACSLSKCGNGNKTCAFIKPSVVAPGVDILSSYGTGNTDFYLLQGTSMAAPHVAGVVALMICANPRAMWNYKNAYKILTTTTNTSRIDLMVEDEKIDYPANIQTNLLCNVLLSNVYNSYPNNMYGYGLVNACKAVVASKKLPIGSNLGWKE